MTTPYKQKKKDILERFDQNFWDKGSVTTWGIFTFGSTKHKQTLAITTDVKNFISTALDEIALEVAKVGRVEEKESELRKFHGYFEANEGFNAAISQSQNQLRDFGLPEGV